MTSQEPPKTTSISLLIRLQRQEPEAWLYFEAVYMPYIKRCCKNLQLADQEDIARDVYLRVQRKIGDFKRQRDGSFRKWLRTITYHLISDRCEANRISVSNELMERFIDPSATEKHEEENIFYEEIIAAAGMKYSNKWLRCFLGMRVYGLTAPELAEELGMTQGAVRKASFKVRKWLCTEFGDLFDDSDEGQ